MKLREKPGVRNRQPKSGAVLNPETPSQPTLNEQLGLPAGLKERWDAFLEKETDDLSVLTNQVGLMGDLTTLYPAEAGRIRRLGPLEKLVEALTKRQELNPGTIPAWSRVKLLAPELVPPLPDSAFVQEVKLMREAGTDHLNYFDAMRTAAILFPERAVGLKGRIAVDKRDLDLDKLVGGELLRIMKDVMMVDPTFHSTFHAYTNSHRTRLEKIAQGWKNDWTRLTVNSSSELFSAYKLILAEEIEQLSSGLLMAVEETRIGSVRPLPERSLAV